MAILRDAADKLKAIGVHWDMQTGRTMHEASIALIASETEEGVAAGYVASYLGHESAELEPTRFAQEVAFHLDEARGLALERELDDEYYRTGGG